MIATRELQQGDIIEIAKFDDQGGMNLRRVRVIELVREGLRRRYRIVGVNMKGETPISYRLPLSPSESFTESPNSVEWCYFVDDPEMDE